MSRLKLVSQQAQRRKNRVRASVSGTTRRPRMSIFISDRHVSVQLIDDENNKTLVAATTIGNKSAAGTLTEKAAIIGVEIATKAKSAKIKQVVLDRGKRLYHGRIRALAEAARKGGLEF